jgi:putative acetyltransferase
MRRLAATFDFESVFRIYMHEAVVPFLGFDPMPREEFEVIYRAMLASGGFYVVEVAGQVKGFYKVTRHEGRASHVAYLGTLAVAPEAQGSGLARAMIEEAMSILQNEGVSRIELMLEADNPRALGFYRKLGFEHEGTMRAAYKRSSQREYIDELFLAKLLLPHETKRDIQ